MPIPFFLFLLPILPPLCLALLPLLNPPCLPPHKLTRLPTTAPSLPPSPTLSIIIPAYNEASRLPPALTGLKFSLRKANLEPLEVLICSDGPTDDTCEGERNGSNPNRKRANASA